MKKRLIIVPFLCSLLWFAMAQTVHELEPVVVPAVGMIGEYEASFAALAEENPDILLGVCGNDMDIAYEKWTEMLIAMEDYAESIAFDINGLKTYFYIFWNNDGTVRHLAFYPKANSRNIPVEELRAFFKAFVKEYQMPVITAEGFSHYGSATFPTLARPEYRVKRD